MLEDRPSTLSSAWRLDSPALPAAIALIAALAIVLPILSRHQWNPSVFVTAGDRYANRAEAPSNLIILRNSEGYDGQFYYRLAFDPLTNQRTASGVTIDIPQYRQQRILLPAIVWAFSFGRPLVVPTILLGTNIAVLSLIGWIGGRAAQGFGRNAIWGAGFALYPGFALSLARDLTEILAGCLVLAALLSLRQNRHVVTAVWLSLAALARETTLILAAAFVIFWLFDQLRGKRHQIAQALTFILPFAVFVSWQIVLRLRWQHFGVATAPVLLTTPFASLTRYIASISPLSFPPQRLGLLELCFLAFFIVCVAACFRSTPTVSPVRLAWLVYIMLPIFLAWSVWWEHWSFMRVFTEAYIIGLWIVLQRKPSLAGSLIVAGTGLWLCLSAYLPENT